MTLVLVGIKIARVGNTTGLVSGALGSGGTLDRLGTSGFSNGASLSSRADISGSLGSTDNIRSIGSLRASRAFSSTDISGSLRSTNMFRSVDTADVSRALGSTNTFGSLNILGSLVATRSTGIARGE